MEPVARSAAITLTTTTMAAFGMLAEDGPDPSVKTLSLQEVKTSWCLASLDVILFVASGLLAEKFFRETRKRNNEMSFLKVDLEPLLFRACFLRLLSLSNYCRAAGIIFDAFLRLVWARHHQMAWRHWFDYILSSFPTMLWMTMLSLLLGYWIETYHRTQFYKSDFLRPMFFAVNFTFYFLYIVILALTLNLCGGPAGPTYTSFRHFVYFLLGCWHTLLVCGLLRYGVSLTKALRRAKLYSQIFDKDEVVEPVSSFASFACPSGRIVVLVVLLPITELLRTFDDLEYSLGGMPFDLYSGLSNVLFLACAKLALEWVPSAAILWAFRPTGTYRQRLEVAANHRQLLLDPLIPPGQAVQDVESGEVRHFLLV